MPDGGATGASAAGATLPGVGSHGVFAANSCFTDPRIKTMMVKTPSTVPKGIKAQTTPAMTRQNR
jgi:hypothetical protein